MDIMEIERRIAVARDRVATLQHRADEQLGVRDPLLHDTLHGLQTSMEELTAAVADMRQQTEELAAAEQTLAAEQQRYRDLFEFAPIGYLVTAPDGTIREANRSAARLLKSSAKKLQGKPLTTFMDMEAREPFRALLQRVLHSERALEWSVRLHPHRSLSFDAAMIVSAMHGVPGTPASLRWVLYDVTAERRADEQMALVTAELERQVLERTVQIEAASRLKDDLLRREREARNAAEAAQERLALIASASAVLHRSLDPDVALRRVAALALPLLGEWGIVDVLEDDGTVRRVAVAHVDPAQEQIARELQDFPATTETIGWDAHGLQLDGQRPELVTDVDGERLRHAFPGKRYRELIAQLHPMCWMRVPLLAQGEVRGLVTLIGTKPERKFGPADLTLAEDLVRRGAAAVEQSRLYRQAQEANQTKSSFLATMSHELRTPLNAIIGYAELLLLGIPESLPHEAERQVGRIRAASEHLLSLIEEILTFSRIDAGSERLFMEPLLPVDIAHDAASLVEPLAHAKGLGFTVDVPVGLPLLETDPGKLRQILVNLLSNAVKFTHHGEVALSAREHEGGVAFVVRDTGVGIAPEYQERVFEAFWQVRYPAMHHAGGTGLGLSVSRQLARMLGGDLTVESAANQGSTFTVWLPSRERRAAERAESETVWRPADTQAVPRDESVPRTVDTPVRGERARDLPHGRARPNRADDERHELGA